MLIIVVAAPARGQSRSVPLVPGAAGFGMETLAAYGGSVAPTVYRVNNLNNSGTGSLRAALEASGPRVVIFEISGTIALAGEIFIQNPYITVAGQTAPAPGITVRNYGIVIYTHDVLLQHLRLRHGGETCGDSIDAWGGDVYNIVLDHVSASWGQDETVAVSNGNRPVNMTIWRSILSEGLNAALNGSSCNGSPDGTFTSHGLLIYQHTKNISVLQSLFAHNLERNPYTGGDTVTYIANNVIYDFDDTAATQLIDSDYQAGALQSTVAGNYFKRGPSTSASVLAVGSRYLAAGSRLYLSDNARAGSGIQEFQVIGWPADGIDPRVGSPPVAVSGYAPISSSAAYGVVLAKAGSRPNERDVVDARVVSEVQNGTGFYLRNEGEVGGWPSLSINVRSLTVPSNPHSVTASGYTVLEEWLHGFAAAVEDGNSPPPLSATSTTTASTTPPATTSTSSSTTTSTNPSAASPSGTTIPGAASITDNSLAVWTLGSGGEVLRNGTLAVNGAWWSQILWYQNTIYIVAPGGSAWRWTGNGWASFGPISSLGAIPPPTETVTQTSTTSAAATSTTPPATTSTDPSGTASQSGTTVPGAASIIDNSLGVWTLGAGGVVLRNGSQIVNGTYWSQIVWYQNNIYIVAVGGSAWRWTGGTGWASFGPISALPL